jgi:hypothetical protein
MASVLAADLALKYGSIALTALRTTKAKTSAIAPQKRDETTSK